MLLKALPRLKSGADPKKAFSGTFHINESYTELEDAYATAKSGRIPEHAPSEMYCHTLTDPSILSDELANKGFHTLTLFGLHTPAELFEKDNAEAKKIAQKRCLDALNTYLIDPIESVLAVNSDGSLCIEVKSPLDLEKDVRLPGGNIFHRDLTFPFKEEGDSRIWGVETDDPRIFICGAGAQRGGGVSGIPGHNAAMAVLAKG
jgi:phytoene dehydrogenase-like protein